MCIDKRVSHERKTMTQLRAGAIIVQNEVPYIYTKAGKKGSRVASVPPNHGIARLSKGVVELTPPAELDKFIYSSTYKGYPCHRLIADLN